MDEVSCCGTAAIFAVIGLMVGMPGSWWRTAAGLVGFAAISAGLALNAQAPRTSGPRPGHLVKGTVKDAAGRPVADVFISALERDDTRDVRPDGQVPERPYRMVSARVGAVTDSNGRYELELPFAGEFYLVALPRHVTRGPAPTAQRHGYGHTFYPGAARFRDAMPVRVRPGAGVTADITLVPARLAVVSGTVFDSTGKPANGGRIAMAHGDGFFGLNGRAISFLSGGRFAIPNLPPGTYFLHFREGPWPPPRGTVPVVSTAKVVVDGEDIRDVRVMPTKPVRASGRLSVEGAGPDPRVDSITVSAIPTVDGNPGPSLPGDVTPDGTFEFRAWPLPSRVRVFTREREWTVKTVRLNGRELPHGIVDFEQLTEVTGLEVTIAR